LSGLLAAQPDLFDASKDVHDLAAALYRLLHNFPSSLPLLVRKIRRTAALDAALHDALSGSINRADLFKRALVAVKRELYGHV